LDDELGIAEMFWRAAYGQESWECAVDSLALPLQARTGQIAMIAPDASIHFSLMSRVSQADIAGFIGHNAHLASVNPRLGTLLRARTGQCVDDHDFLDAATKSRMSVYRNFFHPTGTSNALTVKLQAATPMSGALGFTALRPDSIGAASDQERRLMEAVVPAISGAVELALRFGRMETEAVTAALQGVGKACIALGLSRNIVALSEDADRLLRQGRYLSVRNGRLHALDAKSADRLEAAFADVTGRGALHRSRRFVALRAEQDRGAPIIAELSPVPARDTGPFASAAVLLTMAVQPVSDSFGAAFGDAYGLTLAEAGIALSIAQGLDVDMIARSRRVSPDTVRTQLKSILAKTGTHRQSELASLLLSLSR
jgi:DNA-binding CsgD family transcriptional regulator